MNASLSQVLKMAPCHSDDTFLSCGQVRGNDHDSSSQLGQVDNFAREMAPINQFRLAQRSPDWVLYLWKLYGGNPDYVAAEKQTQLETPRQHRARYTPIRPTISPTGRIVIVVYDGLATGATMIAALHCLRSRKPAKLICAVPVSPPDTLAGVVELVDDMVCLEAPLHFRAVGQFCQHFDQVDDAEVIEILKKS